MREFTRLGKSDGWTALHVELDWMAGMKNSSGAAGLPRRKMERIVGKHKFNRLAESADATKYDSTLNELQLGQVFNLAWNGSPDIRLNRLDEGAGERTTRLNQWRQPALVWRVWLRGIIHRLDARWR